MKPYLHSGQIGALVAIMGMALGAPRSVVSQAAPQVQAKATPSQVTAAAEAADRRSALEAEGCGPGAPALTPLKEIPSARIDPRAGFVGVPKPYTPIEIARLSVLAVEGTVMGLTPGVGMGSDVSLHVDKVVIDRAGATKPGDTIALNVGGGIILSKSTPHRCGESVGPALYIVPGGQYLVLVINTGFDGRRTEEGSLGAVESRLWYRIDADGSIYPLDPANLDSPDISSLTNFENAIAQLQPAK